MIPCAYNIVLHQLGTMIPQLVGMYVSQDLVEPVALLIIPAMVSVEEGTKNYSFNALPMELIYDVNQCVH